LFLELASGWRGMFMERCLSTALTMASPGCME
jgi:hypothetical protein